MSFYHPRAKRSPDATVDAPGGNGTAPTPAAALPFAQPAQNWAQRRKAKPVDYLLPASRRWFEGLPIEVRPMALADKYPRIVNLIAQQWNDYEACSAYFGELLAARRGHRQGFPSDVERDLRTLVAYYQRLRLVADGSLSVV